NKRRIVLGLLKASAENSWSGFNPPLTSTPSSCKSTMVAADKLISLGLLRYCEVSHPPIMEPIRKRRFHRCDFQSKSKNLTRLPAPAIVQMVRKLDEKPKVFPQKIRMSMTAVISKPEMYQGQGCLMNSTIVFIIFI